MNHYLVNFKGLYGDNTPAQIDFIHHEKLETRSQLYDWEINEHLHTDLIQIFIFKEGKGIFISEKKKMSIESPSILLVPANTLHGFAFQAGISGEVLTFSENYFEALFKNDPKLMIELNRLNIYANIADNEEIMPIINGLFQEIHQEKIEKKSYLENLFRLFFLNLYRIQKQAEQPVHNTDNRSLVYFLKFQKNIKSSLFEEKSIQQYAKELTITAVHLNRICQQIAQKSALQIIQEHTINEAKKYLKNTQYSVSEISYFLNFKDPAYFTRLFKKQTGLVPSEFRKQSDETI